MTTTRPQTVTTETSKIDPAASFRDFTEQDWQGFQGCESDAPRIWDDSELLCVVIDDRQVCANYRRAASDDATINVYQHEFKYESHARIMAEMLVRMHAAAPTDTRFETLLESTLGDAVATM